MFKLASLTRDDVYEELNWKDPDVILHVPVEVRQVEEVLARSCSTRLDRDELAHEAETRVDDDLVDDLLVKGVLWNANEGKFHLVKWFQVGGDFIV